MKTIFTYIWDFLKFVGKRIYLSTKSKRWKEEETKRLRRQMIGYSKGGAEAIANAVSTGRNAITFNPMNSNLGAYGLNDKEYTGEMTYYRVGGEILGIFGNPSVGQTKYLPTQYGLRYGPYGAIRNHAPEGL